MSAEDIVMDADNNKEVPAESTAEPVADKAEAQKDSVMDDSDLSEEDKLHLKKALRQIEFYFADSNLPYDKFMWTLHTKLPTHWVPLSSVSSFKRMRPYTILFGLPRIAQALKAKSTLLEVQQDPENDAEWQVRRRTDPKPPVGVWERSVYAKGFSPDTTQDELEDFFSAYGSTNEIRMRRDDEKNFKGSVFVEFTEESGVDAFLTADPKPKFKEEELVCMTKEEYCTMKVKEKGLTGKAAQFRKDLITRHKFDAFRNTKDASSAPGPGGAPTPAAPTILEYLGAELTVSPEGTILEEDAIPFLPRATLKFSGEFDNVSFNALKEPLRDLFEGVNPFVKYQRGDKHGYVGFHRKLEDADFDGVKNALKTVDNKDVTWEFISEDEEKAFQIERAKNAARMITRRHEEGNAGRGRGRGRGRGDGRGRGRGRGGDRGRGGRGGRGGGRDHGRGRDRDSRGEEAENAGDKRKRAVEPDGGPDVGVRGVGAPPAIKKTKSEGEAL